MPRPKKEKPSRANRQFLRIAMDWEESLVRHMLRIGKSRKRRSFYTHEIHKLLQEAMSETISMAALKRMLVKMQGQGILQSSPARPPAQGQAWSVSEWGKKQIAVFDAVRREAGSLNPSDVFSRKLLQDAIVNAAGLRYIQFGMELLNNEAGIAAQQRARSPIPYLTWEEDYVSVVLAIPEDYGQDSGSTLSLIIRPRSVSLELDKGDGVSQIWGSQFADLREKGE